MQRLGRNARRPIQSALEIDGAGAGHDVTHAVGENGVRKDGRGAGAIADDVAGSLGSLTKHLGAEIFFRILEIEFLGDGHPVITDDRRAPVLLNQD